ncbi:MAG: 30S ribosomal protein S12 methylthiotransferase RimO [Candidatus Eisenbacteria bacterium]
MDARAPEAPPRSRATRVAFIQLGCPKNLVDGEIMMALVERAGMRLAADIGAADVAVINTCAFIADAEREAIGCILETARLKRHGRLRFLIVAGCLAQRRGEALLEEMPEIDGLIGPSRCRRIADVIRALLGGRGARVALGGLEDPPPWKPRLRTGYPHVAYVKIAEGCDHRCRFCLIPRLRGPQRSRRAGDVVGEVRRLAREGTQEVVLVAQDTTAYGRDLHDGSGLAGLLRRLNEMRDGPAWIRLLYTHPAHWTDELMGVLAARGRVLPYIDVPVQHASDQVLTAMGRGRSGARIRALIERLRARIPDVVLRTTVMTGHPGEGPGEFAELLAFVRQFPFDRLGAFAYSPEPDTGSATVPGRPLIKVARERRALVLSAQKEIASGLQRTRVGRSYDVLVDGVRPRDRLVVARSYGEAPEIDGVVRVRLPAGKAQEMAEPGEFLRVRIVGAGPYDLLAVPAEGAQAVRTEPRRKRRRAWKEES